MCRRRATRISPFDTGLQQDPSYQHSQDIATNPDTMSSHSPRSPQKWDGHAFTLNREY